METNTLHVSKSLSKSIGGLVVTTLRIAWIGTKRQKCPHGLEPEGTKFDLYILSQAQESHHAQVLKYVLPWFYHGAKTKPEKLLISFFCSKIQRSVSSAAVTLKVSFGPASRSHFPEHLSSPQTLAKDCGTKHATKAWISGWVSHWTFLE